MDSEGCAYVTGVTYSEDFPTRNPYQATSAGNDDAFVAKLSEDGTTLAYSTYLGGTSYDVGEGIAVDSEGCAYITGFTGSGDFPTTDATFQKSLLREADAYVARLCFEIKDDEQPPAAPHRGGAACPVRTVLLASVLAGGLLMLRRRMAQI